MIEFDLPPEEHFWSYPAERSACALMEGLDVFFIGMFCLVPGTISVRAIVRTGTIAKAIAGVPLRFKSDPDKETECTVHLVEMRSWGGESGSPVFIYDDRLPPEMQYGLNPGYESGHESRPWLLGLLFGQFEMHRIVTKGKKEQGVTTENTGIGIVIPIGEIKSVLRYPVFVDSRERAFKTRTELANRNLPK